MATSAVLPEITASANEGPQLREFARMLESHQAALIGPSGGKIPLPGPIYKVLVSALRFLERGEGVMILPSTQEMTTQSAADLLGVSRQYVVQLLEEGKIPFHKVGTHRRVSMKDVLEFRRKRDNRRKQILGEIAREAVEDGTYDLIPPSE
ncbi:MAG: helix-turn-helix domain-containing protein [Terracidiphilus sp.]